MRLIINALQYDQLGEHKRWFALILCEDPWKAAKVISERLKSGKDMWIYMLVFKMDIV